MKTLLLVFLLLAGQIKADNYLYICDIVKIDNMAQHQHFAQEVNMELSYGYTLAGGISVTNITNVYPDGISDFVYLCQALVKRDKIKKDKTELEKTVSDLDNMAKGKQ